MNGLPLGRLFAVAFAASLACCAQMAPTLPDPAAIVHPVDFSGLGSIRLPLVSTGGVTWTATRYTLQGSDVTDPYLPGRVIHLYNPEAMSEAALLTGLELGAAPAYGSELAFAAREPGSGWRTRIATGGTAGALASSNLPAPGERGLVRSDDRYHWLTRDTLQSGGPLGERADALASFTGQWASQTAPRASSEQDVGSRSLLASLRGRLRLTRRDQLDGLLTGARMSLFDWGMPAGLEAWAGRRLAPSLAYAAGFAGLQESDRFNSAQAGWTRQYSGSAPAESLHVSYASTSARMETFSADERTPAVIDMELGPGGAAPPLANRANRDRRELAAAAAFRELSLAAGKHRFSLYGAWDRAGVRNRWRAPGNCNLITARGAPAAVVVWNTPADNHSRVETWKASLDDRITFSPWLAAGVSLAADAPRGSLPDERGVQIRWRSLSPRFGLSLAPLPRLALRAGYARLYAPLASRYLDYGSAYGLGGAQYEWLDADGGAAWEPAETGRLLARFGSPYSDIGSRLARPHARELQAAARLTLPRAAYASLRLFRRDETDRIAAVNIGVPDSAFTPVRILDPGPDGVPGTSDDQGLTVYAQEPASLGQDRYLLTNPPGLRMMNEGLIAEIGGVWRRASARVSFMAAKAFGPANPGNSEIENDPGVTGALFHDPNTAIYAAGRAYFDRAYAAKAQLSVTLPRRLGGLQIDGAGDYLDGLAFGRRLLVTGFPQGPFLVAATVRGSPEGGHRTEYLLNWNLRVGRTFPAARGSAAVSAEILNLLNAGGKTQEMDITGPLFNRRLPVSIQPPRFVRLNVEYQF